jgi:hypothetical protein
MVMQMTIQRIENCLDCIYSDPIPSIKNVITCHNDNKFTEIGVGCSCLNFKQKQLTVKTKEEIKRRIEI